MEGSLREDSYLKVLDIICWVIYIYPKHIALESDQYMRERLFSCT